MFFYQTELLIQSKLTARLALLSYLIQLVMKLVSHSNGWHSCFVFERYGVHISVRRSGVLNKVFRGFPQPLQVNTGIVSQIRPRPLLQLPFWLIIHQPAFHWKLCHMSYCQRVQVIQKYTSTYCLSIDLFVRPSKLEMLYIPTETWHLSLSLRYFEEHIDHFCINIQCVY